MIIPVERMKKDITDLNKRITKLSKRESKTHQKLLEMQHYWKVRCEERKALSTTLKTLSYKWRTVVNLKRHLDSFTKTNFHLKNLHSTKKGEKTYPLFITRNEYHRLRQFFGRSLHRFIRRHGDGKSVFYLTSNERIKFRRWLNKNKEKE